MSLKIAHIMIASAYIEGASYQENILPKKHKELGLNVFIITSQFCYNNKKEVFLRAPEKYVNHDGIEVTILKNNNSYFKLVSLFRKKCIGLFNELKNLDPNIIFVHGGQGWDVKDIIKYKKLHIDVKIYVDQHLDYYNAPINTIKGYILNKCIQAPIVRRLTKYTEKFWGTTPWRVHYLNHVYKIASNKIGLLIMGGDEEKIDWKSRDEIRNKLRSNFNIRDKDFLIVTGGKIDRKKNIQLLMKAVSDLKIDSIKLAVFGVPDNEMKSEFDELSQNINIRSVGWIKSEVAYDWFLSSDLAFFPGTHSVLWEQAVACGIPIVCKYWEGMTHVNVGGNAIFINDPTVENIKELILWIVNSEQYNKMFDIAQNKSRFEFQYIEIAKRSIELV